LFNKTTQFRTGWCAELTSLMLALQQKVTDLTEIDLCTWHR